MKEEVKNMKKLSKNAKLNNVLNSIYDDLMELGIEEVKRYYNEFKHEKDYNLYQYGNVLIYNDDIRELYKEYKSLKKASMDKIIEIYKRQVGYIARMMVLGRI